MPPDEATPPVEINVTPQPPADVAEAQRQREEELTRRFQELEARISTIVEEGKTWTTQQITEAMRDALQELATLKANATTGMENLSQQMMELRQQLQDLLIQRSQEPPQEIPPAPLETPPEEPEEPQEPAPPAPEGGDTPTGAPAPNASPRPQGAPAPRSKRVI